MYSTGTKVSVLSQRECAMKRDSKRDKKGRREACRRGSAGEAEDSDEVRGGLEGKQWQHTHTGVCVQRENKCCQHGR